MKRFGPHAVLTVVLGALFVLGLSGQEDSPKDGKKGDKLIYRNISADKLEGILKELGITYQKVKGKEEGVHFYDFERNKFKTRLHNYAGKDLWIDAHFTDKLTLEEVNQWNIRAKFSRAVLLKGEDPPSVSLESQLDCLGGVSDAIIRQFITRFDGEVLQFVKYLTK